MRNRLRALLAALGIALLSAFPIGAEGPFRFYPITPCRLVDTSGPNGPTGGPALNQGEVRAFPVFGLLARPCGIPADAKAAALNVCALSPSSEGHLILFATGDTIPAVSTINFAAGVSARANGAVAPLGSGASYQASVQANLAGAGQTVHVVLDITGYYR